MHYLRSLTLLAGCTLLAGALAPVAAAQSPAERAVRPLLAETEYFVLRASGTGLVCDAPTLGEHIAFETSEKTSADDLHVIYPGRSAKDGDGLTIVLEGTSQLENFPAARNAFIAAAQRWESIVRSPISIILRVDFGPTRFGTPYPEGVIGSTGSQNLLDEGGYPAFREALVAQAASAAESETMNALPTGSIPTDIGATANVIAPSSVFRALGMIAAVADPSTEPNLGAPPSIGFNSNFSFDFNPNDGITPNQMDFDAVTVHEIGHALGFVSRTGIRELSTQFPLGLSTWDIFRFRPGASLSTFGTAPRIMSSGGEQVFFAGSPSLGLSTGRPDGTGGDGRQASHWKDDVITRSFIGIMDPTINFGVREEIQPNDERALDVMGYALAGGASPLLAQFSASLEGDVLSLGGAGSDADGGAIRARIEYLDPAGAALGAAEPVVLQTGGQTSFNFSLDISGVSAFPAATRVRLTLLDANFNVSESLSADFTTGDEGGPQVATLTRPTAKSLVLRGTGFRGALQLQVNGANVAPRAIKANGKGTKVKITGTATELGLREGANRVRIKADGLRSNIVTLTVQ